MTQFAPSEITFAIGDTVFTLTQIAFATCAIVALLTLFGLWRGSRRRAWMDQENRFLAEQRARESEAHIAQLVQTQAALTGQLGELRQGLSGGQEAIARQLDERLANVTGTMRTSLTETTEKTQLSLAKLQERLAVIDAAQTNIQGLAENVVGLQAILQNKQTRGAFGEARMEAIVRDGLPMGSYAFQDTLTNGKRPDCTVAMPNGAPSLVVDAKFPLEGWEALRAAERPDERKMRATEFARQMGVHISKIAEDYLITGETQDTAFLFVPSESIFADIHENFEGVVQRAHKARIVIVSPSLLMLSIQVIQALLKDARMREQAHLIQAEIAKFANDLRLLDDRVGKLQTHFGQTQRDVDQILVSTAKLKKHGDSIESMEFQKPGEAVEKPAGKPFLRAIEGGE